MGKRVGLVALAISICVCGFGCGKSSKEKKTKTELDIAQCVSVSDQGFDGMGVVECQKESEEINEIFQQAMKDVYGDNVDSSTKRAFSDLEQSVAFLAEPSNSLSNGDKITIKMVYDEQCAEKCNVEFLRL